MIVRMNKNKSDESTDLAGKLKYRHHYSTFIFLLLILLSIKPVFHWCTHVIAFQLKTDLISRDKLNTNSFSQSRSRSRSPISPVRAQADSDFHRSISRRRRSRSSSTEQRTHSRTSSLYGIFFQKYLILPWSFPLLNISHANWQVHFFFSHSLCDFESSVFETYWCSLLSTRKFIY